MENKAEQQQQRSLKRPNEDLIDEEEVRESFSNQHFHRSPQPLAHQVHSDDEDGDLSRSSAANQRSSRFVANSEDIQVESERRQDDDDEDDDKDDDDDPFGAEDEEHENGEESDDDEIIPTQVAAERAVSWYLSVAQQQVQFRTGLAYDDRMRDHKHPSGYHPECPERVESIMLALETTGLASRMHRLPVQLVDDLDLLLVHSQRHLGYVKSLLNDVNRREQAFSLEYRSAFASDGSVEAAYVSAGCVISALESISNSTVKNALCVVRPPGHHAERDQVCGFCLFDNVAVAAAAATTRLGFQRVLVLDWDIHHGNGIQHAFEDSSKVLYISIHRWDSGGFYPGGPDGGPDKVGINDGEGYNINVAWNNERGGFTDADYFAAFESVVMPAARAFNPDLVFVSAGFDAAIGDPLGGCAVSPYGYGEMLHMLSSLAGGKIIVALEGGYCLPSISASMLCCGAVLLGDGIPPTNNTALPGPSVHATSAIVATLEAHAKLENPFSKAWTASYSQTLAGQKLYKERAEADAQSLSADDDDFDHEDDFHFSYHQYRQGSSGTRAAAASSSAAGDANGNGGSSPSASSIQDVAQDVDSRVSFREQAMLNVEPASVEGELKPSGGASHPYISANIMPPPSIADGRPGPAAPCDACETGGTPSEPGVDNFACLKCYNVFCCSETKNGHAREHAEATGHCIAMSLSHFMMWDFRMNSYVSEPQLNSDLRPILEVFHEDKFGEALPTIGSSLSQ